jgi:hypothetical protein
MRHGSLVVALALTGLVLAPPAALAGRDHAGRGGGPRHAGNGPHGLQSNGGHHGSGHHAAKGGPAFKGHLGFNGHGGFKGHDGFRGHDRYRPFPVVTLWVPPFSYYGYGFYGYGGYGYGAPAYAAPPVYYPPVTAAPPVYTAPPVYAAPPAYVAPIATVSVAPAPPTPRVIEHPNGRFELRGDGFTEAHSWVWIPNPPPPPPDPPPAPTAATRQPSGEEPAAGDGSVRRSRVYRWTDDEGVVHITNRPDAVPRGYDQPAKRRPTL